MPIRTLAVAACLALALIVLTNSQSTAMPLAGPGLGQSNIAEVTETANEGAVQPVDFYFYFGPRRHYYGFGYYPHHYYYAPRRSYRSHRRSYRRSRGCGYWSDRCAANWGYGNNNYRGCLRYHGCY